MSEAMPMPDVTDKPTRWQNFSAAKKTRVIARGITQGVANLLLILWAVRDLRQRPDSELNGNKKIWWAAVFAPPIGPLAYFIFGRKRGATGGGHVSDERPGE